MLTEKRLLRTVAKVIEICVLGIFGDLRGRGSGDHGAVTAHNSGDAGVRTTVIEIYVLDYSDVKRVTFVDSRVTLR